MPETFLVGDSISVHYGPFLEKALRPEIKLQRRSGLQEALKNLDVPSGANSGDSDAVLEFLSSAFAAGLLKTQLLLVNCGLHDIKTDPKTGVKQVPLERYASNLRAIVKLARTNGVPLMWTLTTPCDEKVHNKGSIEFHRFAADAVRYNDAALEIMKANEVPAIDLFSFTEALDVPLYCDHVHFLEPVRKLQGEFIARRVNSWFMLGQDLSSQPT